MTFFWILICVQASSCSLFACRENASILHFLGRLRPPFSFSFGEFFQPRKELNLWGWRGLIFLYSRKDRPKVHRNLNRTDAAPSAIGRTELQRQEGIEKDLGKGIKSRMWFFLFIGKWSETIRMSMWTEVPHSSFFFNSGIFFHSLISGF